MTPILEPNQPTFGPSSCARGRAYLLEDNVMSGRIMTAYLKYMGFTEIDWDERLSSAEMRLSATAPDAYSILVFDVGLPDGDSLGLLSDLKVRGFKNICGYCTTVSQEDQDAYLAAGFDHIFSKPLSFQDFVEDFGALVTA